VTSGTLTGAATLFDEVGEAGTLDELIVSKWTRLSAHRSTDCPVCGGEMRPEYGVHARPIGGRCSGCGSTVR
jgi:hypothetical protein